MLIEKSIQVAHFYKNQNLLVTLLNIDIIINDLITDWIIARQINLVRIDRLAGINMKSLQLSF